MIDKIEVRRIVERETGPYQFGTHHKVEFKIDGTVENDEALVQLLNRILDVTPAR